MGMSRSSDVPSTKIKFKLKTLIKNTWYLNVEFTETSQKIIVGDLYDYWKSYNFDFLKIIFLSEYFINICTWTSI